MLCSELPFSHHKAITKVPEGTTWKRNTASTLRSPYPILREVPHSPRIQVRPSDLRVTSGPDTPFLANSTRRIHQQKKAIKRKAQCECNCKGNLLGIHDQANLSTHRSFCQALQKYSFLIHFSNVFFWSLIFSYKNSLPESEYWGDK